tara:strand:- start:184 stop:672 length:489 start_codon:yes stop_codon:yes gene_type:complete
MCAILTPLLTGIFALAGVALASSSALLVAHLQAQKERHRLSREKLEELSLHVVASLEWLETANRARSFGELSLFSLCPSAQKATSLAWLYFPELCKPTSDYSNSIVDIHRLLIASLKVDLDLSAAACAAQDPDWVDMIQAVKKSRQAVLDKIQEVAPQYIKA